MRRGGAPVVRDVSLEIAAGKVTGLLGPSGSGKTTLLRAIVGVQIVEAGSVTVLGLPAGSPELRRRVGYVTQEPSVYGDMSVRENLRYFARILGAPPSRISEAIDEVDLDAQADQLTRTSGRCTTSSPRPGEPCSSPATSWTRPSAATSSYSCATA